MPKFKGKMRLGRMLFSRLLKQLGPQTFRGHYDLRYTIPNTKENIGAELLITGVYEKELLDFLLPKLTDGAVFIDVGANIGAVALPLLKNFNLTYYGFEASPKNSEYLKTNFSLNGFPQNCLYNNAVYSSSGKNLEFFEAELYGKSALAATYSNSSVHVMSIALDDFCADKGLEYIDWLKIDVQGFELRVLEGLERLLSEKKVRNIILENESWAEKEAGIEEGSALRLLKTKGYKLCNLRGAPANNEPMIHAKA